jgi:transposase
MLCVGGVFIIVDQGRFVVSDETWGKVAALLPGKASDRGVTARDNRLFLEAVLWRVSSGLPWRDLPGDFGNWNSVFQRFRRWAVAGVFECFFERLAGEPDFEYALIDGTIICAHQKASGAKGGLKIRPSGARAAD